MDSTLIRSQRIHWRLPTRRHGHGLLGIGRSGRRVVAHRKAVRAQQVDGGSDLLPPATSAVQGFSSAGSTPKSVDRDFIDGTGSAT